MSIYCMIRVFKESKAKANDRLVLLAIADEANDDGENAHPSIRLIAEKANCHTDTVVECIKTLEAMGELQVTRPEKQGRGHFNRYKVLVGNIGVSAQIERGSVRPRRKKSTTEPRYLRAPIRTNPSTDPSTDPRENVARMPEQRDWCKACEGTSRAKNSEGLFTHEPCAECQQVETQLRRVK